MNYKNYLVAFYFVILFAAASSAHAEGILNMGFSFGGDTLAERSDGAKLDAGGGFSFEAGVSLAEEEDPIVFQFLVGTKFDQLTGSLGGRETTAKISAMPLHAMVMMRNDRTLIGGGLAYYMNPTFKDIFGYTSNFDNSMGLVFECDFGYNRGFYYGIRFTSIKLKGANLIDSSGNIVNETDASSLGLLVGMKF